ncbi:hypothetical protein BK133_11120 [Paenibacillus sp. FSL H8-0548]|uniref:M23 family metallopeptidase n=1 Tax=Paenibacillus sp. FSL H8-0548 TaxID=1920422 RepID=UPI00096C0E1B|nr:M23 family metallopeptidase [Paenibacillus sp. FSL H8-0548]OMF35252.1 hypothetical protein BK133_11120 [Paenibacillus sp. FSL H8-0548]
MANWDYDSNYRLTSPFGMRDHPIKMIPIFHRGVDLVVTPGNGPLYAFVAGTVIYAKQGIPGIGIPAEMGIVVAIKDDKGYLHLYAHLSAAVVKVGQQVLRGQKIGNQGTTGASTGNHLHYEIRKTASPSFGWTVTEAGVVEPTKYLQDYYKVAAPVVEPQKEDEDKLELTNNQWGQLDVAVQSLLDKGIITDKAWAEKVKSKKLTLSEISWLNTIVLSRK